MSDDFIYSAISDITYSRHSHFGRQITVYVSTPTDGFSSLMNRHAIIKSIVQSGDKSSRLSMNHMAKTSQFSAR